MRGGVIPVAVGVGLGLCAAAAVAVATPASADTGKSDAATTGHRSARVAATAQPSVSITRSGQSPVRLSSGSTTAAQLSGITAAGGTTYYSVGDNGDRSIWQVYTSLNTTTGRIRSSTAPTSRSRTCMRLCHCVTALT